MYEYNPNLYDFLNEHISCHTKEVNDEQDVTIEWEGLNLSKKYLVTQILMIQMTNNGKLFIVPTPIGNLEDITIRAIETLKNVDLVLAEDTRKSSILFKKYLITTPLKSYHINNEHKVVNKYVEDLIEGKTLALVSDAGTPSISDPGFLLIRESIKKNIEIMYKKPAFRRVFY